MSKRGNGEGSIYQDTRGLYRASLSLDGGKRKYFSGRTRKEVADKLATALQARQQGTLVAGPRQTVAQHLERWLEDVVRPHLRPRSYVAYSGKVRIHILPTLGKLPITALTPQHLQRLYAAKLSAGLAPKSVNDLHVVAHRGLEYALRWGLVARNVADAFEAPRVPRRELQPFTPEELGTLLAAMAGHRHEPLWLLMLATGLRFGEAAALRWQDVDLEHRAIHVRHTLGAKGASRGPMLTPPKTDKGRRDIPLPQIAVQALVAQRAVVELLSTAPGWQELDLVFTSNRGTPLNESHVLPRFQQLLAEAGLPKRRMHDLRHTYATRLFALGQHPRAVQDLLGHSRFEITMNLYTATVPEVLREAADRMDSVFDSARLRGSAPRIAALRPAAAHHAGTPGRVAARVAAQRSGDGQKSPPEG
jgi:integrase